MYCDVPLHVHIYCEQLCTKYLMTNIGVMTENVKVGESCDIFQMYTRCYNMCTRFATIRIVHYIHSKNDEKKIMLIKVVKVFIRYRVVM